MGQLKFFIFIKSESLGKTSQGGLADANLSGQLGDRIHSKFLYVINTYTAILTVEEILDLEMN